MAGRIKHRLRSDWGIQRCPHRLVKGNCAKCNPRTHGNAKHNCVACKGCPHGKLPRRCAACRNSCPHGKAKGSCTPCKKERANMPRNPRSKRLKGEPAPDEISPETCVFCPNGEAKHGCAACKTARSDQGSSKRTKPTPAGSPEIKQEPGVKEKLDFGQPEMDFGQPEMDLGQPKLKLEPEIKRELDTGID